MANVLESVGERTIEHLDYVGSLNIQWWATLRAMGQALPFVGNRYRWQTTVRQMLEIGVDAMPMVSLMAICSGFILAMQGASELCRFGALHYVIELVAVGFTRELGPLLTAIAVSGRSGSAFAAEIGTMKVTEELDSLRVMALDPTEFVLAPRYLAALIPFFASASLRISSAYSLVGYSCSSALVCRHCCTRIMCSMQLLCAT